MIFPTYDRAHMVTTMLRLLKRSGLRHPLIIADSSSDALDDSIIEAAPEGAELRRYPTSIDFYEKLADVVSTVRTPFVLTIPDKKITVPYAIDELVSILRDRSDYVSAAGYVVRFGMQDADVDLYRVSMFAPSIVDEEPLRRLYAFVRRYVVSVFAAFRTEALLVCAKQASTARGLIFQEVMFMNSLALQGKISRVPVIFGLHGRERSNRPIALRNPMHWFLSDGRSFFEHYREYCASLAALIHRLGIAPPQGVDLNRLLDLMHAAWLGREVDTGMISHMARSLLGDDLPPLVEETDWPGPRPIGPQDLVDHRSAGRRHIWRGTVLNAQREEITIGDRDVREVNLALDIALEN